MSFKKHTENCALAGEQCLVAIHSSGLKVILCERKDMSSNYAVFGTKYGSVDTDFAVDGGKMQHVPDGIAHFLEHKLFEGEDGDAFTKYSVTGASANAYTSFDRTCYLFSCSDKFYENLDILLSFVSSPYFTPETVAKEQGIIGQEIKMYEDVAGWRVLFNLLRCMYSNHPVKIEIAGTVESIAEITDQTLYDCYNTFYSPSNMFVAICGNFDSEKVLSMIDEKIEEKPQKTIVRSDFNEPNTVTMHEISETMAVAKPIFVAGIKDKVKESVSPETAVATELLLEIAAGKISPLYDRLQKKGLINNGFSTEYLHGFGYGALLFEGESSNPYEVADQIKAEILKIQDEGVDGELFISAKKKLFGREIRRFNDTEETVGVFIDSIIEGTKPYARVELLSSAAVTSVNKRAKELDLNNFAISVINPKK
jgi:predicted Zn-dependent peptidase